MSELELAADIHIDAPVGRVWGLVSDVRRMCEWSPQVTSTRLRSGFDTVGLGTQFTNRNRAGEVEWTTHAEIVGFEPEPEISFRVEENWMLWSFTLTPDGVGTRLAQRRDAPEGINRAAREWVDEHLGDARTFAASMGDGMRTTLERIKADAGGR